MEKQLYRKIYIIGSVASGKTTMAKNLSKLLNIPWHELDNVFHMRLPSCQEKRTPEGITLEFNKIISCENWIIEGVIRECFNDGFDKADAIILLNTPPFKRKYRIAKRWIYQRLKVERSNYSPTFKMLKRMYKWSSGFEKSRENTLKIIEPYNDKVIILKDNTDVFDMYKKGSDADVV
jgi:adenylate kinase family enzyme